MGIIQWRCMFRTTGDITNLTIATIQRLSVFEKLKLRGSQNWISTWFRACFDWFNPLRRAYASPFTNYSDRRAMIGYRGYRRHSLRVLEKFLSVESPRKSRCFPTDGERESSLLRFKLSTLPLLNPMERPGWLLRDWDQILLIRSCS